MENEEGNSETHLSGNASHGNGSFEQNDFNTNFALHNTMGFSRRQFNIASGIVFSLTLILVVFVFKDKTEISRDTLNVLLSYTASFAGLSIALPLFLRDASFQAPLFRSFLLMGLLFTVATITGIITLIFNTSDSFIISLDSKLPKLFIIPLSFRIILSVTDLLPAHGKDGKWNLDYYKVLEFIIILLVIALALPYSEGETAALILMVLYASTYFLSLILALLIQLVIGHSPKDLDAIVDFIKDRVNQLTNKALTIDSLHQEIITKFKGGAMSKRKLRRLIKTLDVHYLSADEIILPNYDFRIFYKVLAYFQKYFYVYVGAKEQFDMDFIPLLKEKLALEADIPVALITHTPGLSDFMASIEANKIYKDTNHNIYIAKSLKEPTLFEVVMDKKIETEQHLTDNVFLLNKVMTNEEVIKMIRFVYDPTIVHGNTKIGKKATFKKKP